MGEDEDSSPPRVLHRETLDPWLFKAIVVSLGIHVLLVVLGIGGVWLRARRVTPVSAHTVGLVTAEPGSPLLKVGPLGSPAPGVGGGSAPDGPQAAGAVAVGATESAEKDEQQAAPSERADEATAKQQAQEEAARRAAAEETARKQAAEAEARRAAAEDAARAQAEKEAVQKLAQQKAAEQASKVEEAKRAEEARLVALRAADEAKRKAAEDAAKKRAAEEAARKAAVEEAAKRKAAEEAAKKKAVEEAARKKAAEEEAKRKAEAEAAKKAEEAAKKKAAEEAARQKAEEAADARQRAEADAMGRNTGGDGRLASARAPAVPGGSGGPGGAGGTGQGGIGSSPGIGGGGAGGGGDVRGIEFVRYYEQLMARIRENWVWVGEDQGLAVTVRFSIQGDGRIVNVRRTDSSGNSLFDQSVEGAVRSVRDLGPPPDNYRRDFADVEVVFRAKDLRQ